MTATPSHAELIRHIDALRESLEKRLDRIEGNLDGVKDDVADVRERTATLEGVARSPSSPPKWTENWIVKFIVGLGGIILLAAGLIGNYTAIHSLFTSGSIPTAHNQK